MKEMAADIRLARSNLEEALVKSATRTEEGRRAVIQLDLSEALIHVEHALELAEMREGQE